MEELKSVIKRLCGSSESFYNLFLKVEVVSLAHDLLISILNNFIALLYMLL